MAWAFSSCCAAPAAGVAPSRPAVVPAAGPWLRSAASMEALLLPPRPGAVQGVAPPRPAAAVAAEPSAVPGVADPAGAGWPTPSYAAAAAAAACTCGACCHQGCHGCRALPSSACSLGCCRQMCHTLSVASSAVVAIWPGWVGGWEGGIRQGVRGLPAWAVGSGQATRRATACAGTQPGAAVLGLGGAACYTPLAAWPKAEAKPHPWVPPVH